MAHFFEIVVVLVRLVDDLGNFTPDIQDLSGATRNGRLSALSYGLDHSVIEHDRDRIRARARVR